MARDNVVNGQIAEDWIGVGLERGAPLGAMFRILPAVLLGCDALLGALTERRRLLLSGEAIQLLAPELLFGGKRIDAVEDLLALLARLFACIGEIEMAQRSEADIMTSAKVLVPENPRAPKVIVVLRIAAHLQV